MGRFKQRDDEVWVDRLGPQVRAGKLESHETMPNCRFYWWFQI